MKATIQKTELSRILSIVSRGMSSRSTLPILSGVLISTIDHGLRLQTTDLEISIRSDVAAYIEEDGAVVVSGKLFENIVHNLPDRAITLITNNDSTLHVEDAEHTAQYDLKMLDPADFPAFPELMADKMVTLNANKLARMVDKLTRVVSKDESRATLTGILFSLSGGRLQLVATDSYRLAISSDEREIVGVDDLNIIIPGKSFGEMMKSASDEEEITIGTTDNQIVFSFGRTTFISRKIEGNYPNYKQLIPPTSGTVINVNTAELVSAIKQVALLAQTHTPIKFEFSAADQCVNLTATSSELGNAQARVGAEVNGESVEIGFNHQYVLDGLNAIDSAITRIEVVAPLKPGVMKSEDGTYLYLAMPVRLG